MQYFLKTKLKINFKKHIPNMLLSFKKYLTVKCQAQL